MTLPSLKMRDDAVFGSMPEAAQYASTTFRNEVVNMKRSIGLKTSYVNGLKTDFGEMSDRLFYRTMSQDLLRRIQIRLDKTGLSESGAPKLAGMSDSTIRNMRRDIEAGKSRSMSAATVEKLAAVLRTTSHWLLTGEGSEELEQAEDYRDTVCFVPLISWVSAGKLEDVCYAHSLADAPRLPIAGLPPGDWIALDVTGDSMDRLSPPGSRIVVNRRDTDLRPGGCYVVVTEQGEATFKRYKNNPDRFEPVSTNPAHEPLFPHGPLTVVGRVRRTILDL